MFTGIIQKQGCVLAVERASEKTSGELRLCVDSQMSEISLGESIAVNGVCLTVTEFTAEGRLFFYASRETLDRSNLSDLEPGSRVNLERALLAHDRLSGHIVQGHVDGQARFLRSKPVGESFEISIELPPGLSRYCVEKGSISLNGVSLTINSVHEREVRIMLIPHTWKHTNLSQLDPGNRVNVEIDILAKYMEKLCQPYQTQL